VTPSRRWIAVALALAAALGFSLSVQAIGWWTAGEVAFGPFGAHDCFGGECRVTGLAWLGGDELWLRSAVATRVAGYVATAAAIMLAGAVAAKRVPRLVARMLLVALASGVAVGAYFAARCPAIQTRTLGAGLPVYAGATACALAAAVLVLRTRGVSQT
jgi:hypothetical protein